MTDTLKALHDAATAAPWDVTDEDSFALRGDVIVFAIVRGEEGLDTEETAIASPSNAALIVALRNAYADGALVARADVDALRDAGIAMHRAAHMTPALKRALHDSPMFAKADAAWDAALDRIGGAL